MLEFKAHRAFGTNPFFREHLSADQPKASELTFTNLFMWRHRYCPEWGQYAGCLLIVLRPKEGNLSACVPLAPVTKGSSEGPCWHLKESAPEPMLARVCGEFVKSFVDPDRMKSRRTGTTATTCTFPRI